jgi:dUTP pyrophosphatase
VIKTGLAVEIPDGYELQIRARSGLATKGLIVTNGVGTIDSDYRGEVGVILSNVSSDVIKIEDHQRVAQCCLQKVITIDFNEVEELSDTERGEGGYGNTGL